MGKDDAELSRMAALDALRGGLMVLMAVDHAAYFIGKIGPSEIWSSPLPDYPNALAFLTRYLTHLCAPGFSLLLGVGVALYAKARSDLGWSQARIALHLAGRGLVLIVLEQALDNPAWLVGEMFSSVPIEHYRPPTPTPTAGGAWLFLGVLFELGGSMIVCGCLLRLGSAWLLLSSLALLAASHWLILVQNSGDALPVSPVLRVLFVPDAAGILDVSYPLAPWIAIASMGMVLGRLLARDAAGAYRAAGLLGAVLLAAFLGLRASGLGDVHPAAGTGWIDFLRVTKYPPSPAYLCLTLGADLLLLSWFGRVKKLPVPLLVFGRTALFFYIAHLWLFCLVGLTFPAGLPLPWVYPFWLAGLALLYPACQGYGRFKRGKPLDSLWRML